MLHRVRELDKSTSLARTKSPIQCPWTPLILCIIIVTRATSGAYLLLTLTVFSIRDVQIRYRNCTKVELPTLSHGLDGDDFTAVSTARRSDGHHPDAVLTVPAQVGDAVEKDIWGRFKLAAHLREKGFISTLGPKALLQGAGHNSSPLGSTAQHST